MKHRNIQKDMKAFIILSVFREMWNRLRFLTLSVTTIVQGLKVVKREMAHLVRKINANSVKILLELRDQYYNMREKIEPVMHIIDTAFAAMEAVGVKPNVKPFVEEPL